MAFKDILGQELPKQILSKALKNQTVANSYLFYGPESVGKKLLALELAKSLNCGEPGPGGSCGACVSCQKIQQGTHPDVFLLEPSKSSPTVREGAIRIDDVRGLQKKLGYLPYEGMYKVAVVNDAELMNLQAANSFLKTLEDPPGQTVIILIAANPFKLLPTIVSRCQGVKFHPLSAEAIKNILSGHEDVSAEELETRATLSQGQVDRALDPDLLETAQCREGLLDMIETVSFKKMDVLFEWTKTWAKNSARLPTLLDQLTVLLRDLAYAKSCGDSGLIKNADLNARLQAVAAKKKLSSILNMFENVQQTQFALSGNANVQLALENMLLNFCSTR